MLSLRHAAVVAVLLLAAQPVRAEDKAEPDRQKMLTFLAEEQAPNGSWGPKKGVPEIGITALVAKAVHECDAPKDMAGKQKEMVEKAVDFILKSQQKDGSFSPDMSLGTYRTAIAVLCLCSVDRAKYADQIKQGTKWLESAQFSEDTKVSKDSPHYGGWGYDKKGEKPDADLSNAQWAIAALKEAGVSKDDPVMKRAVEFVARCQNDTETNKGNAEVKLKPTNDHGFFYGPTRATQKQTEIDNEDGTRSYESYASMTYAGLTSLVYATDDKKDPRIKAALKWIEAHYTLDENYGLGVRAKDPKAAQVGLYYYYLTFAKALSALGENEIDTKSGKKAWAKDLLAALAARQKADGSFVNEADRYMEGIPVLCTAYALSATNLALKHVPGK
jgi:squalene-hopene/tetraprenyl-beta-curcumene cyclase